MSDIVERLRRIKLWQYDECSGDSWQSSLGPEAADEIERLRAVLQSLTTDPPASLAREPDTDCEVILKMREIARRALEPKP